MSPSCIQTNFDRWNGSSKRRRSNHVMNRRPLLLALIDLMEEKLTGLRCLRRRPTQSKGKSVVDIASTDEVNLLPRDILIFQLN